MAKNKAKRPTQKVSAGRYIRVPYAVGTSPNYRNLSRYAKGLLLDLMMQLRTHMNGDLVITLSVQREQGWTSNDMLHKAKNELLHYGFIMLTRQGGRNLASYYAMTFVNIETTKDIDVSRTKDAPDTYKENRPEFKRNPTLKKPPKKQIPCPGSRDNRILTVPGAGTVRPFSEPSLSREPGTF